MTKLQGNNPYEMVNHATGKLASKLQGLIEEYEDSPLVSQLANEFISWWNLPFDDPDKDSVGRSLWDRADQIKATLSESDQPIPMTKLERAGNAVGSAIGKASGVTANATIAGATATNKWVKDSAAPAVKAGGIELWKGFKATARATREAYRQSRANKPIESKPESDDKIPY